jgi:phosphate transport system substrate-binding protein
MVNLCQRWAEAYMKNHSEVRIVVTGGGSGNGINALLNGSADFACMSRELILPEKKRASKKGIKLLIYRVAYDGVTIAVNQNSKLEELTLSELKDVFTGKVRNFNEVGGDDISINLYGRENNSGTYSFFKESILKGEEFSTSTQVLQGTAALVEAVANDKKGIAYGGLGYFINKKGVKIIKIKASVGEISKSPVEKDHPNYEDIRSGKYLISRSLLLISGDTLKKEMKEFLNFVLSSEGQKIVAGMNYIPLK